MINTHNINTKTFFENAKKNITLTEERLTLLKSIATKIVNELADRNKLNLNFICTHNSRRSQIAQVWSFYAIEYFKLTSIHPFSGGTEVTAFHRNTVKSLQKVGFEFSVVDFSHQNPRYLITFKDTRKSILGFSKTFDNEANEFPYIAITTCDNADENCPFIPDAIHRFHLPYIDPKIADNTEFQQEKYLETNQQIAGEIFILFNEVSKQLND
ncbi:arsenate reductase [Tenacibaculum adriaticum]|uniref:Arsenate reductase n=1 Tax=Tenacibaculum adriaticum TaxID=413713 RepID=A0A5S5DKM6_9FLAO|nr:hypothetical protein [Tenacibaculum adriaticum]TYP96510.1 arsenate reductase [Tenacibaculum adriaticum]